MLLVFICSVERQEEHAISRLTPKAQADLLQQRLNLSSAGRHGAMEQICDQIGLDINEPLDDKLLSRSKLAKSLSEVKRQRNLKIHAQEEHLADDKKEHSAQLGRISRNRRQKDRLKRGKSWRARTGKIN